MSHEDDDITNILETIYSVPHTLRMNETYWRVTRPERFHACRSAKFYRSRKGSLYPGEIRLEAVREKDWCASSLPKHGAYCLDLFIVNGRPLWVIGVYRSIRELKAFVG